MDTRQHLGEYPRGSSGYTLLSRALPGFQSFSCRGSALGRPCYDTTTLPVLRRRRYRRDRALRFRIGCIAMRTRFGQPNAHTHNCVSASLFVKAVYFQALQEVRSRRNVHKPSLRGSRPSRADPGNICKRPAGSTARPLSTRCAKFPSQLKHSRAPNGRAVAIHRLLMRLPELSAICSCRWHQL